MASIDTAQNYSLINGYTTSEYVLGLTASASDPLPIMDSTQIKLNDTAIWFITPTDTAPFYRMHTVSSGTGLSLDVINDAGNASIYLHMTETGDFTGQYWRFDSWGDGTYSISNNYTGEDNHLDVYSDTLQPHLATGDHTGAHWTFQAVKDEDGPSTTGGSGPSASASPSLSSSSSSPSPATTGNLGGGTPSSPGSSSSSSSSSTSSGTKHHSSGGLSAGVTGGIVGGAAAGVAFCVLAFLFFRQRKKVALAKEAAAAPGPVMYQREVDGLKYVQVATAPVSPGPGPPPYMSQSLGRAELGTERPDVMPVELDTPARDRAELVDTSSPK